MSTSLPPIEIPIDFDNGPALASIEEVREALEGLRRLAIETHELAGSIPPIPALPADPTTPPPGDPEGPWVPPTNALVAGPFIDQRPDAQISQGVFLNSFTGSGAGLPGHGLTGDAPIWVPEPGVIRAHLRQQDRSDLHGGATGSHEGHLMVLPQRRIDLSVDIRFVSNPLDGSQDPGQTGKNVGLVGWNDRAPDWSNWPGGNRYGGPQNFSLRVGHNTYRRDGARKLIAYLYIAGGIRMVDFNPTMTSLYASNTGPDGLEHTGEFKLNALYDEHGPFPFDEWINIRVIADTVEGTVMMWVGKPGSFGNGDLWLALGGVQWSLDGPGTFERVYVCELVGGAKTFYPLNADNSLTLDYRRLVAVPA